jgi:hypothetical protein
MMLPMKNNHPIGEKSPYLATLDENQMQALWLHLHKDKLHANWCFIHTAEI